MKLGVPRPTRNRLARGLVNGGLWDELASDCEPVCRVLLAELESITARLKFPELVNDGLGTGKRKAPCFHTGLCLVSVGWATVLTICVSESSSSQCKA